MADHKYLLMGGRNMFDYFLGTHKGKSKGVDREILIVNQGSKDQGAVGQIRRYFQKVWNLEVCKTKFNTCSKNKKEKAVKRLLSHAEKVKIPEYDYQKITVPTKKTTLVTNPTTIYGKEPVVFETLKQLMLQAKNQVIIHTPYAVFSKEMYEGITQVKQQVPDTTMILNSIASGDNICASADYRKNRSKILDTGISLYEYMGKHSTHGKSLVIDDDIAVVGSYNFDCRSTYVDTETMLVVQGKEITKQLEEDFDGLKNESLKVNKDGSYQFSLNCAEIEQFSCIIRKHKRKKKDMKDIKIIFFDIDGTLIAMDKDTISDKTLEALKRLQANGIKLCLATGRGPMLVPHFDGVEFDDHEGTLYSNCIPSKDIETIVNNAVKIGRPVALATKDRMAANGKDQDLIDYYAFGNAEVEVAKDFEEVKKETVYQVLMGARKEEYQDILKGVQAAEITAWWNRAVDIIPINAGKGIGIEKVLKYYGIEKS